VAARAGVSKSVFTETFPTVEQCYRSAFEDGLERLSRTLAQAVGREAAWLERVRAGLVAMLGFFDDEPSWARLLVLETPLNTALVLECRRQLYGALAALLEREGEAGRCCGNARAAGSPMLLAALNGELVVGGVFSVIRTSMVEAEGGKLVELAPSLMAFIVAPYLGQAAAQAELQGRPSGAGVASVAEPRLVRPPAVCRAHELPVRATHRTTLVLRAIAQAPYSNNREIAQAAGLADEGQASKLLARLEQRAVIENVGVGAARGEPNAWLLTPEGQRVLQVLTESFADRAPRRTSGQIRGAR
jgi:AcrR family transcriptional regulator